jgi:hypothetical protein
MFKERIVEDFMSARGTTLLSLYMDPGAIVDTEGSETVRLHSIIPALSACTLKIQTAVTPDGPWRTLIEKTAAGETFDELECDPDATYRLDRYIRWELLTTAAAWTACFSLLAVFEAEHGRGTGFTSGSTGVAAGSFDKTVKVKNIVPASGGTATYVSNLPPSSAGASFVTIDKWGNK